MTGNDESELQRLWRNGDYRTVATLVLLRDGPEILGVLTAILRSEHDAGEVFSLFAEDLWRGLPGFQWRCPARAWAHRIARNAAARWRASPQRNPDRHLSMDQTGVLEIAERVRSTTEIPLRTEVKSEIRRLRDNLSEADQRLLIYRIDKHMRWSDIAAALADEDLDEDELKRETARLRKRFQHVTDKLRALARERGILDPEAFESDADRSARLRR